MRGNARRTSRIGAYVASAGLVISGAVSGTMLAVTPADAVAHDPVGVNLGAGWLQGELTNGVVHNSAFNFDDIALSADFAYTLNAVGGHATTVNSILDAIEPRAHDEWYTSTFNGVVTTYGGSIAKLLVLVQQTGGTPTSFGGHNLVSLLNTQVANSAPIAGRVQNTNDTFGDANTIGQAYAAHGLKTANSAKAASATSFLLKQQCPNGGFRLSFNTSKTAAGQSCTDNATAETDATAIAILQLASQAGSPGTVATAVAGAKAWLVTQQKTDGSWGGGPSTQGSNANSTGLAAQALGNTARSEKAAQWLRDRQVTYYDACDRLSTQGGAVAYDNAGLTAGRSHGITSASQDQWRRASAQAVPALAYLPLDTTPPAPVLSGPSGYLKTGTRQVLTTGGVNSGDRLCLTGVGAAVQGTAAASTWRGSVTLPAGTRSRLYKVRDIYGHSDTQVVKVLGRATLSVTTSAFRVKRSHVVTASIDNLAPTEWARIFYKGRLVSSGHATTGGKFAATFRVGRAKGRKHIVGYGQFTDIRRGATVIKVVR